MANTFEKVILRDRIHEDTSVRISGPLGFEADVGTLRHGVVHEARTVMIESPSKAFSEIPSVSTSHFFDVIF
jgi:hypothetical protein